MSVDRALASEQNVQRTSSLLGDPDVVGIEFELEEPHVERWLFGRFRLWARGQAIGDWDDVVTLFAVVNWWRSFVASDVPRWDPRLDGLDRSDLFGFLADSSYGDHALDDVFWKEMHRFDVGSLGMSAFDPYLVFLVEPPGDGQRLLWSRVETRWNRETHREAIHEVALPPGALQRVGEEFVAAIDSAVSAS